MSMVRWFFGQRAVVLIVVVVVTITAGAIVHIWLFPAEESYADAQPELPPALPQPELVQPELVLPTPPSPAPALKTLPSEDVEQQKKPIKISKVVQKRLLPRPRPRVWQVEANETFLSYRQDKKLVWCAEEHIEGGKCLQPLDDTLVKAVNSKPALSRDEFDIDAFGITHIPTGASFIAYPAVQRFGFFRLGRLGKASPNGKKYDAERVLVTMKEMWRERMDSLDPNGPLNSSN